jgi:hypothetical protein
MKMHRIVELFQKYSTNANLLHLMIQKELQYTNNLMPCPFTGPKTFCARPKIYVPIVAVTNILCQTKRWFALSKIDFCAGTKGFEDALNEVEFLGWLKKFGLAQNILGPVKGQGINGISMVAIIALVTKKLALCQYKVEIKNLMFLFFVTERPHCWTISKMLN